MSTSYYTAAKLFVRYAIVALLGGAGGVLLAPHLSCRKSLHLPSSIERSSLESQSINPLKPNAGVLLAELTWMDVRDKIRSGGFKRVIIPTGGIEQNGPFVALNKHDIIAEAIAVRAAKLANGTLVAPVVSFTPEGQLSPPTGHMHYAGTISVTDETFIRLLTDIGLSLAVHGFTDIVLIGDSGDSQTGLQEARQRLQRAVGSDVSVRFIHDFYDYDEVRSFLRERGVRESQSPFHEELAFSLQLLALKPAAIRYEERIQAGFTSLGDVSLLPREKLTALGEAILNQRASKLARLIQGQ